MVKSILSTERRCFLCGSVVGIEYHHIFGAANRKKSTKYGLVVPLCKQHHNEPPNGVHHNSETRQHLQSVAQQKAMEYYGWTEAEFRNIFGKNYL